jgi:16S rRNA processing protein RimM
MEISGYTYIGTLAKLHGFKGEYVLVTDNSFPQKIEKWESVFILIDELPIPFFIASLRLTSENTALIIFDDINTSEQAKEFVGYQIYQTGKESDKKNKKTEENNLNGYKVFDVEAGYIGIIDSIIEYSQNILFRILDGDREILIPAIEEYILSIDPAKKEIHIESPEGLLNLND